MEEKSDEPWFGRRILGVAGAGAVAVAFFLLSGIGDSTDQDQTADDPPARPRRTMKAPDTGGMDISRDKFNENPKHYFKTNRQKGPKAAVDAFR
ncbi:uncharacterized protein LOC133904260 [Phragmites australis]|uniref:uncharacterized protein LOC133904260 n=1 Tax=Phragmites australis TaxID=29695 RepID=UPI002D79F738|nr:uncharacterized protein LOC133904260 [Phragmites australis]